MARVTIRLDLPDVGSVGPGKVRLLELVAQTGSIRQAGLMLKMSYARAWGLIRELNEMFGQPLVEASAGGRSGGGAALTPAGEKVVALYRAIEAKSHKAVKGELQELMKLANPASQGAGATRKRRKQGGRS
jgi:molybdate transport system regulatory protein